VRGSEGLLTVSQPSDLETTGFLNIKYEWDLRFNSEVPMDMKIDMGVGGGDLELGDLNLRKLTIDVGVGGADISLDGDWEADLEASIKGGVGGLKVTLPRDVGVRVEAESGLGAVGAPGFNQDGDIYTNDAYGRSNMTLNVKVEVGVGGVELNLGP
ncbi:MAG TPA: LiaF domain-containing protein, partial [Anaerolineae bacterium]|nr:LiaF domain-containing protein [Anaerolineae bacterium]